MYHVLASYHSYSTTYAWSNIQLIAPMQWTADVSLVSYFKSYHISWQNVMHITIKWCEYVFVSCTTCHVMSCHVMGDIICRCMDVHILPMLCLIASCDVWCMMSRIMCIFSTHPSCGNMIRLHLLVISNFHPNNQPIVLNVIIPPLSVHYMIIGIIMILHHFIMLLSIHYHHVLQWCRMWH